MKLLNKILTYFTVVFTLLAFTISTTGFTSYTHSCSHHESHKSIVKGDDDCCAEIAQGEEILSCCAVKQSCHSEEEEASCCDLVSEYNKLSQFFVQSEFNPQKVNLGYFGVELFGFAVYETVETEILHHHLPPILKNPKKKIYRLFHQVKIEPPLV